MANCAELLSHGVLFAFDRQLLLAELISDLDWTFDVHSGLLAFGDRFKWGAEVLGTVSEETGTWLWAWQNDASGISAMQQGAALKLKP